MLLTHRRFQQLQWWSGAPLQAECLCHSRKDQFGILNGGKRDEADSVREVLLHLARDLERQARLAHASRAGEGQETYFRTCEQGTGGSNLPLPSNEGRANRNVGIEGGCGK